MKIRVPLYARMLGWFFLNLAILAAVFWGVFKMQFRFGIDSLLLSEARQRLIAVSWLIRSELDRSPQKEWTDVLARFSQAYHVQFYLFRDANNQLAGPDIVLPLDVAARLPARPIPPAGAGPGFRHRFGQEPRDGENLTPHRQPGPGRGPRGPIAAARETAPPGPPAAEFFVKTSEPTRYWAGVTIRGVESGGPGIRPLTVVTMSESISGGGLYFDYWPWLTVTIGVVVFSALFWFPLARGLTRSIARMTRATEQIAAGKFEAQADDKRRDELGRLGQAINSMASRLSGFVSGQRRFLGDIAHELCSPIARMQVALGILDQRADEKQRAQLEDLREEIDQMSGLVNELLSFSKASLDPASIKLEALPLSEIVGQAVRREAVEDGRIIVEVPKQLEVKADRELLLRSLTNLLRNGLRYAGHAGPITISARGVGATVEIIVADQGPGVPDSALERLFDPFYRPEPSRDRQSGGVGLGLAIVKTCVERCGGTVSCANRKPAGFEVTLKLNGAC